MTIACSGLPCAAGDYAIVDTGQVRCYDDTREVTYPKPGEPFSGQDAQYEGNQPAYRDNRDGTVTDLVTGLMWQKGPAPKMTYQEAVAGASACRVGGHDDWRLPTIKELYSLILFSGTDPDPQSAATSSLRPFIDADHFAFEYGDASKGERIIDSQYATSTKYVSTTMHGNETMFGVNFADGRIKGYPVSHPARQRGRTKTYCVLYVRGNAEYGKNQFRDNGDGTITDDATGLTWTKEDSGHFKAGTNRDGKLNWQQALQWAEGLDYAGRSDWRLPNVKELQSIVDYTRSPDTSRSPALDPIFSTTPIRNGLDQKDYAFYWSGTTHVGQHGGQSAAYVAFGRSQGWMRNFQGQYDLLDVHGAGSQRSDPKAGDPSQFPRGRGPQGDVISIYNLVRPVRDGSVTVRKSGPKLAPTPSGRPNPRGPMAGGRPGFVSRLDRDGDGRVSRREFDGPPGAFDRHDANNDGYLTDAEAPHAGNRPFPPPRGLQGRRGNPPPNSPSRRPDPRSRGSADRDAAPPDPIQVARVDKPVFPLDAPPNFVFLLVDDMGWTGLSAPMHDDLISACIRRMDTGKVVRLALRRAEVLQNKGRAAYNPAMLHTSRLHKLVAPQHPRRP